MTASHAPGHRRPRRPAPDHLFRPGLPVRLRRLARASGGPGRGCRPSGTAPRSRSSAPGAAGMVAAYELMRLGLKPVIYEAGRIGGRLRSQPFEGAEGSIAELGGMRFPISSTAFFHYLDRVGLETRAVPEPAGAGDAQHGDRPRRRVDLRRAARGPAAAVPRGRRRLARGARGGRAASARSRTRSARATWRGSRRSGTRWCRSGTIAASTTSSPPAAPSPAAPSATARCSARSASAPAAGTPTSPTRCWRSCASSSPTATRTSAWSSAASSSCRAGCGGGRPSAWRTGRRAPRSRSCTTGRRGPGVARIAPAGPGRFAITDRWGDTREYPAVLVTCQSWLLTTHIDCDESLFSPRLVDGARPHPLHAVGQDLRHGRPAVLERPRPGHRPLPDEHDAQSDRLTRGTYLFDHGPDRPSVICLSYTWMGDALKLLPLPVDQRVELMLAQPAEGLSRTSTSKKHIIGDPITVSWESDPNFLGAFKGALPGHYRYNRRMYCHFMQDGLPPHERGIFLAGDDISWTPGLGRGCRHHRPERGLGHPPPSRRPLPPGQPGSRRPLRRAGPGGAAGLKPRQTRRFRQRAQWQQRGRRSVSDGREPGAEQLHGFDGDVGQMVGPLRNQLD